MAMNIRFQKLPEELEARFRKAFNALVTGGITDLQAVEFFFKYFFQRLEPMYRDNPKAAQVIKDSVKGQIVGFVVEPDLVDVTLHIETISDLRFTKGVSPRTPSLIFSELENVIKIILAYVTVLEALINKMLKIRKMANILRWLAPIATIQTEEIIQKVRDEDLSIMDRLIRELGF